MQLQDLFKTISESSLEDINVYVDEDVDEPIDEIDTSYIEMEDAEIRYLIRHFAKSGKL